LAEINAVARTIIYTQLGNSFAHRLTVAKVSSANAAYAR
jgi:hypothetical protein